MKFKAFFIFLACFATLFSLPTYSMRVDELLANEKNTVDLFQKYSPSVVYVHRMATVMNRSYKRTEIPAGAGSGIIWDSSGHIVTNFHVIKNADKLAISIGKLTVPARVIGAEPRKDIAVLSLKSPKALALLKNYVPFELAKTNELMVGQKTIAIGNPFGLDHSLSVGVISAVGRRVPGAGGVSIKDMIQTDTSINPGNSGGPLLDSKGRLIGLNTAIYSNSGSSAGVGFAVPADDIARIVPQIIKKGRVVMAGIGIQWVGPAMSKRLGIKNGILVGKILPKSPAAKAGLKGTYRDNWGHLHMGDLIIALNDRPIKDYDVLYNFLANFNVGAPIKVTVIRQAKKLNFNMRTVDIAAY